MKLEKFLLGCSPLPWSGREVITGPDKIYGNHAANTLPMLVDLLNAMGNFSEMEAWADKYNLVIDRAHAYVQLRDSAINAALAAAEEVKT